MAVLARSTANLKTFCVCVCRELHTSIPAVLQANDSIWVIGGFEERGAWGTNGKAEMGRGGWRRGEVGREMVKGS